MKRLYFVLVIFAVLIGVIAFGTYTVYQTSNDINKMISEIETYAKNDKIKQAVESCEKAEKLWTDNEEKLSFFVNHQEVCEIGVGISALKPLIQYNEKAEFLSQLNEVKIMLTHLAKMENVKIE